MENIVLLRDAFNIYYEKGMEALKNNDYVIAKLNILAASETLLKMAKESKGVVKAERMKRAEELIRLADKIKKQAVTKSNKSAVTDLTTYDLT